MSTGTPGFLRRFVRSGGAGPPGGPLGMLGEAAGFARAVDAMPRAVA